MPMPVVALSEVTAAMAGLVAGGAAGLGELIRHGERVPPGSSFAGQYDTVLDGTGTAGLLAAVETCRRSPHHPRAAAHRAAHDVDPAGVRMAGAKTPSGPGRSGSPGLPG